MKNQLNSIKKSLSQTNESNTNYHFIDLLSVFFSFNKCGQNVSPTGLTSKSVGLWIWGTRQVLTQNSVKTRPVLLSTPQYWKRFIYLFMFFLTLLTSKFIVIWQLIPKFFILGRIRRIYDHMKTNRPRLMVQN